MSIENNIKVLSKKLHNEAPIAIGFETSDKQYVYDAGTGKVLACKEIEYKIIDKIICNQLEQIYDLEKIYGIEKVNEAFDTVMEYIEKEHILEVTKFKPILIDSRYKEKIEEGQQQLTLELTQECNLRCKYCIYHEGVVTNRNFGTEVMTEETAFRAIDCFAANSTKEKEISITFYGGEPLLQFELMKSCIEYANKVFMPKGKELSFGFTTNLTLVTPEISRYLAEQPKINIIASLDGPEEIHNHYRVDISGKGTFSRTIRGLKYLVTAFGERAEECLSINMVYAPPYSKNKLQVIAEFYEQLTWLSKKITKRISYVEWGTLPKEVESEITEEEYESNTLVDRARDNIGAQDFTSDLIERSLLRIYHSPVFDESVDLITMNGCCIPGNRRVYVTVDGNFNMCERVGKAPHIGSINKGINTDFIKKEYLDNYAQKSFEDCSKCWAARLCDVCYSHCYKEGKFSIEEKRAQCQNTKGLMWEDLSYYYELLDKDPEKLKYLEEIEVG